MTPQAVRFHAASGALELHWHDGLEARLEGPHLRAACKCAECEQRRRDGRLAPPGTALLHELQPVGEHGLALGFTDGHARGIYPWAYLRRLAEGVDCPPVTPAKAGAHASTERFAERRSS